MGRNGRVEAGHRGRGGEKERSTREAGALGVRETEAAAYRWTGVCGVWPTTRGADGALSLNPQREIDQRK